MISFVQMTRKIEARLKKDRVVISKLRSALVVSRRANGKLRMKLGLQAMADRTRRAELKALRKAQIRLPL